MKKIYSNMRGGLGNLMFDCIHAYTIGKKLNIPVEFHLNTPFHPQWLIPSLGTQLDQWAKWNYDRIFRNFDIKLTPVDSNIPEIITQDFCLRPMKFSNYENVSLTTCWSSFEDLNQEEVQKLFSIDEQTKKEIKEKYSDILKLNNKVSIHVRRGDFLLLQGAFQNLLDNTSYYKDAISICPKDSNFIVFSNNIEDCKKYFNGDNFYFIENSTPLEDLYLQTYCQTNIVANSTFSHWAAYLNTTPDQIVIKPKMHTAMDNVVFIKENIKIIYI